MKAQGNVQTHWIMQKLGQLAQKQAFPYVLIAFFQQKTTWKVLKRLISR